ncbi:hypothetical protein BDZ89DRAFT_353907 [Hymenopellis radicata]|nr:hypothetical protein BDZ89DRAFT_353907 [Hymenopellis radicata]
MPPSIPIPDNITELTGPLMIGHLFNWGLLGALCIQAYIFFLAFPRDPLWPTKALSICIFTIEIIQTCLNTRDAFRDFGLGWGNMLELDWIGTYWIGIPVMGGIVGAMVQSFYAWRLCILTRRYWIPGIIIVLSLTQCIASFGCGDSARRIKHFSVLQDETYIFPAIWLSGTALCDTVIAISMTWTLLRARTGFRRTDAMVFRIVRLSIETGTLCAVFAVLDLVLYLVYRHNNFHLVPSIALTKIYSNSYFAVLNSRVKITDGKSGQSTFTDPSCTCSASAPPVAPVRFRGSAHAAPRAHDLEFHELELATVADDARDETESQLQDSKPVMPTGSPTRDGF